MIVEQTFEQEMIEVVQKIRKEQIAPRSTEVDQSGEFPHDLVKVLGENGLLTMTLPESYGGINANSQLLSRVIEEVSRGITMMGTTMLSTHTVIRMVSMIAREDQKKKFFENLTSGHKLCAICLTEPHAGEFVDAKALSTSAKKNPDGGYILNGTKIFM